jgi:hypothetical protein
VLQKVIITVNRTTLSELSKNGFMGCKLSCNEGWYGIL